MATASFVTDLTEVATQIAEAAAGIGSIVSGFKTVSLARKYYDLYKQQRDFYYTVFQNGVESPLINEANAIPFYYADYAARAATAFNTVTGPFGGESTNTLGWWTRHSNMYADSPDPLITELDADTARLRSDWANYLFRFEELWQEVRNDSRWSKRLAVHNIGLKQGTAVVSSLNSSLDQYQENIADLGNQLATYGNGIAKYVGYKRGLADTADDFTTGTNFRGGSTESRRSVLDGVYDRTYLGPIA